MHAPATTKTENPDISPKVIYFGFPTLFCDTTWRERKAGAGALNTVSHRAGATAETLCSNLHTLKLRRAVLPARLDLPAHTSDEGDGTNDPDDVPLRRGDAPHSAHNSQRGTSSGSLVPSPSPPAPEYRLAYRSSSASRSSRWMTVDGCFRGT